MSERASLVFVLYENGAGAERLAAVAGAFAARGLEATILLTGARTRAFGADHPLVAAAKVQDVGLLANGARPSAGGCGENATSAEFAKETEADYDAVLFAAARVPSCYAAAVVPPQAYAALAEWNVRAVLTPRPAWDADAIPCFLGGRLHLFTELGAFSLGALESAFEVEATASELAAAAFGKTAVPVIVNGDALAEDSAPRFGELLDRLSASGHVVQSVRQFTDRLADVPYDHAVPMPAIQAFASAVVQTGRLEPYRYDLGFLSPAEQAYLLSAVWVAAKEKGKLPRNAQARTPVPTFAKPKSAAPVESLTDAAIALQAAFQAGELPEFLATNAGSASLASVVFCLAKHVESAPGVVDWQVESCQTPFHAHANIGAIAAAWPGASVDEALLDRYRQLLWTFKPAFV